MSTASTIDRPKLLLIDDAADVTALMQTSLESEGFSVETALDGEQALKMFHEVKPIAVILDLGLPGIDGFETCRRLREMSDVHIIILTARGEEVDKLVGFTIGADDYLTKPASMRELAARIRSVARRQQSIDTAPRPFAAARAAQASGAGTPTTLRPGSSMGMSNLAISSTPSLSVDSITRIIAVGERQIQLTRTEFGLFRELAKHSNAVVSRADLQSVVWGPEWRGGTHLVEVHMSNIRRKLTDIGAGWLIQTIREVGYRIRVEITIA